MDYYRMEEALQVLIEGIMPLSQTQRQHIRELCVGVLLAGSSQLPRIARWLKHQTQQDSRIQWLRRVLARPYLQQQFAYAPFVKQVLAQCQMSCLHLVMDRTPLADSQRDLLSVSLNFRKRAIPLAWEFIRHGMSNYDMQKTLLEHCQPSLPTQIPIVFHGDNEFGSVRLMQYLQIQGWDFVVGQSSKDYYRPSPTGTWQPLATLPVAKKQACYVSHVEITKAHGYGPLNIFAFYRPHFSNRQHKHDITYCATSLPITPILRRIGQRRWGIECCFKDFKSAGWNLHLSDLTHPQRCEGLLTVLSLAYLWATCLGRWLCKTGRRCEVDSKSHRHLSLFRLGWDWLVHHYNMDLPCPTLSTLYQ